MLRRMRAPLIVLICIYAISILGFVLIPGMDDQGEPWRMSFFHAFYFVSYMATTIGFGEIPYAFTDTQRFWAIVTIYLSVIAWLYAIGTILTLIQDPALKRALTENRFTRQVQHIREPFYIVCGYGDTGSLVTRALTERSLRIVAIDIEQERINELLLDELRLHVPGLSADAGDPYTLRAAGLNSRHCAGILALTDDDNANLKIAITSKLLNPTLRVICRAESKDTQANMASFGTDNTINPFEAFAEQLAISLYSPDMYLIFEWLTQLPRSALGQRKDPPRGSWIICGYGRFGKAVEAFLKYEGISTTIIEADPEKTGCEEGEYIKGRGTEADTLHDANIDTAAGIVAGTDDDANNLSILMTAKALNPAIYTVARQNKRRNALIFEAADIDQVMQHSVILTLKLLALVTAPLLSEFLKLARSNDNEWAKALTEKLRQVADDIVPDIWTIAINPQRTPSISDALERKRDILLAHLITDPHQREQQTRCLPLMLKRGGENILLPEPEMRIEPNDQILFCGCYGAAQEMEWILQNLNILRYVHTGETRPDGLVWQWLARRRVLNESRRNQV